MQRQERPLSPHLQVYRPQLTMVMSISHRASGIGLAVGSLLLVYWLTSLAAGPDAYARAQGLLGSVIGQLVLFVFTYGLFYHLCNGVRHLIWDSGRALEIKDAYLAGYWVLGVSVALTLLLWIVVLTTRGGA